MLYNIAMPKPKKMNLFITSGPSGSGQDTIIEELRNYLDIERVKTTTTREMRPGESEGNPYYFISKEKFEEGIRTGKFVEYAQEYNDNYYGVTKEELDRVINSSKIGIWKMEYQGVRTAKKLFPGIIAILITTANLKTLEDRIRRRDQKDQAYIEERMAYTRKWLAEAPGLYDFTVFNEDGRLKEAVEKITKIIQENLPHELD